MWNATEGTVWRMGLAGAIILGVLACGLWGMATNNDAGNVAAVTPVPVEVEVTDVPTIDVGDDGANQIIDDTLEVLDSANSALACLQQFNETANVIEFNKCIHNSQTGDVVSEELQQCLNWCEGCYVDANESLSNACAVNETHESNCYKHCTNEYGE